MGSRDKLLATLPIWISYASICYLSTVILRPWKGIIRDFRGGKICCLLGKKEQEDLFCSEERMWKDNGTKIQSQSLCHNHSPWRLC